jgi:rubrerythrin
MTSDLNIMDALKIAMEAEEQARAFYLEAKEKVSDPDAQNMLAQLADFEQYHYDKLAALWDSLNQEQSYITYTPPDIALPQISQDFEGGRAAKEQNLTTVIDVLNTAIDAEKAARFRYTELAERTTDPEGQAMFRKLAQEEHFHYRLLSDELYHLSNQGLWVWSE